MNLDIGTLIIAILGSSVITAFLTLLFTRRKTAAETEGIKAKAASDEVDTIRKRSDLLEKMQDENVDLYTRNTELEKAKVDNVRTIEILTARLAARDQQLETLNTQMNRLAKLAEQAPITEILRSQLESVNKIADELQKMLVEKEKTLQELSQTNRDLEMRKVPKS